MFDHTHYVPVLLTRAGERRALQALTTNVRKAMTPVFAVPPRPWTDEDSEVPPIEEHIGKIPAQLVDSWGTGRAFVDTAFIDGERFANGDSTLPWLVTEARDLGLELVPVFGSGRSEHHLEEVAAAAVLDDRGVCFRITVDDFETTTDTNAIDAMLETVGVAAASVDVVLDLAASLPTLGGAAAFMVQSAIAGMPHRDQWRSLTVVGCSMPSPLPSDDTLINRREWTLHQRLAVESPAARRPTFGDYVVAHPDPSLDIDPKFLTIKASLRYTIPSGSDTYVARGDLFKASGGKGIGGASSFPAARALRDQSWFGQTTHCDYERWISDTADEGTTGGNPTTWRQMATMHHLQTVTEDLASLHGS